jgi:hypothetical protein
MPTFNCKARARDSSGNGRGRAWRMSATDSVWRRPLDVVDHEDLHHLLPGHQLQAELLLQRRDELRGVASRVPNFQ